jgi:conjugal transfer pilus assembly protein TraU
MVDVTPSPYCLVNLGGVRPTGGPNSTQYGGEIANPIVSDGKIHRMPPRRAFYQVHWYINPLFSVLNLITDDACLENKQFDLAYLSELDATHSDIDLANLLTPDAYLFSNVIALGACAADCVAATAGFPISTMFWCAGCNGGLYPLVGTVENHVGGIQSSSLMAQRIAAKLHRAGTQFASTGANGMCGLYPQLIMDKTMYKYAMLNPTPQTKKILGRCCQPFGRTTALWGVGMDPIIKPTISTSGATSIVTKPSYGYMIYRKRDCCQGIVGL